MTSPRIEHIGDATLYLGDALSTLAELPDESVHLICTSPPYWRQRDYGVTGQLGLEETPEEYVAALTAVFREARRVLRSDGSCWINIGDKWAASGNGGGGCFMEMRGERAWKHAKTARGWRSQPPGYKRKDLIGLPFMLAFAMRADGWYWRSTEIWAKPNGMPESTDDRPVVAHEYVLQFSKSERYYYNAEAVRLPPTPGSAARLAAAMKNGLAPKGFLGSPNGYAPPGQAAHSDARSGLSGTPHGRHADTPLPPGERRDKQRGHSRRHEGFNARWDALSAAEQRANGSALRSVWWLPVANSSDEHFAVMPDELAAVIILAGSQPGAVVLDPFAGAGTTGAVAQRLGRASVLIELNAAFLDIACRRVAAEARQPSLCFADAAEAVHASA